MRTTTRLTVPITVFCLAAAFVLLGGATSAVSHFSYGFESRALPFQPPHVRVSEAYGKLPLHFEANQGQTDPGVKFLSRGRGYTLFLTGRGEAVMLLGKPAPMYDRLESAALLRAAAKPPPEPATPAAVERMNLIGASASPRVEGLEESPGKANYFIGNDPKMWRTNVPMYAKVKVQGVYPGVDLVYYGNQRKLEYDFIVAPGADPGSITMVVEGAERPSLNGQGDLVLAIEDREVRFQKPVVYQEVDGVRREISGSYKLKSAHQVGFQVGAYDGSRPLIIDPALSYSTYLGGSGVDQGLGIAVDSGGHAYVTGFTNSMNFPTTPVAFRTTSGGGAHAFVTKLNPTGSGLVYSTYLGGSGDEEGKGIAVDSRGHAYVTGFTSSINFPRTTGAFQATAPVKLPLGSHGAFVAALNPLGTGLVYSSYLGGSGEDVGFGIALDGSYSAYFTGLTNSINFPTTAGAYQTTDPVPIMGSGDAFVTKIANMTCSPQGDDVEGDGGEQGADGHEGYFHFCKSSGEMEFEERDSGKGMKGRMDAVTISGNQALINGRGTLLDGTPVYYAAVVLGNAAVIGANHFAIVWITSTGSFFYTFGPLTNGYIAVHSSSTQQEGFSVTEHLR